MNKFFEEIRSCFNKYASNDLILEHKKHTKKIKIDLRYIILYKFFNSMLSKERSTELINKYVTYSRSSFYRQEKQLELEYYEKFSDDVSKICTKYMTIENKNKGKYTLMSTDGVL